jgi:hypothetical protein
MRSPIFIAALAVLCLVSLTGCQSLPEPPPIVQPAPAALAPSLCVDPPASPVLPPNAALVRPVSPEERDGMEAFLTWAAALVDHDKAVTARAREVVRSGACRPAE